MKPRLIDANALMKYTQNQVSKTIDCNHIARFPTAYNPDKVVKQLKQLSVGTVLCDKCEYREKCDDIQEKYDPDDNTDLCTMVAKSLAIEIVERGGANET